jgi:hypothetical protein
MCSYLNHYFTNPPKLGEPKLPFDISSFEFLRLQQESTEDIETKPPVQNIRTYQKRFWYLNDYEIYYSNQKNQMMIRNYKTMIYYGFKLSSFILRYHSFLKQDDTVETSFSKMLEKHFDDNIASKNFWCNFFINEHDERLWISIKTSESEYLYDITTHFLVLSCDDEKYEWFSLLDNKYVECYDSVFVSNKTQFELLQTWIHRSLVSIYTAISRGTTN